MRSALLGVFFALIVHRGSSTDNDFRPTPIPLGAWQYDQWEGRAGTLHETLQTDAPPAVAAVPAHYWEDALRHSVYLTLVRDKIDQLIAKGDVISPDSKPDQYTSKEVDDHDLWEKIKTAPFDRITEDEPPLGDVTVMAKGRLMNERGGFRFTEDELSKDKCVDGKCWEGVKAFWSVKRVRQRDVETSTGRYHYELTFSVTSQPPKKPRKPYENPVRTFTVRESTPERVVDMPQEHRSHERIPMPTHRPERALWFHKNIVPAPHYQARQHHNGLDRIFFSLFSDDDDEQFDARQRYRQPPQPHNTPAYSQTSKVGYVGSPSDQQKRLTPYPYKPHSYKYSRPPLGPPPFSHLQHHFVDTETFGPPNNQFGAQQDHRYVTPNKGMKTTRPAVLPTPVLPPKNWTYDGDKKPNTTDSTTKPTEIVTSHKHYNKPRPTSMKINYLSDHVRPPVYNAPPGVFVTMDKKPFKPMPPLKLIHSKPLKSHRPVDFRPSPQVLDMKQFSEPDPLFDIPFRPITWNYSDTNTTEKIEVVENSTQANNTQKATTKGKRPPKKHENIKSARSTTSTPEIITVGSGPDEEMEALNWANVVAAFTKTTPMESQKDEAEVSVSTTTASPTTTTTTAPSTTVKRKRTTTTTEAPEETTTQRPKKRTRPPPKFIKTSEKIKKHKRITTTTKAPEVKTTQDLTPQASSAAATKPAWNITAKTSTTTSTTSTTTAKPTTTTRTTTTHAPSTTIAAEDKFTSATTQPKTKNRFRQSTLLTKGTSVNHDKWNTISTSSGSDKIKTTASSGKFPRRKGSNFQGYITSSAPVSSSDDREEHSSTVKVGSTTEAHRFISTSTQTYEETADQYESNGEGADYSNNEDDDHYDYNQESDELETKDHTEYIYQSSFTTPSERTNEITDHEEPITEQIVSSLYSMPKNKTKCKKKKQNSTTTEEPVESIDPTTTSTTTESPSTHSIFEELFGSFTVDGTTEKGHSTSKPELDEQESESHSKFVKIDDDLQDFLDSISKGEDHTDDEGEYDENDDEEPSIDDDDESSYNHDDENASSRDSNDSLDYHDRPYSLLELMAME